MVQDGSVYAGSLPSGKLGLAQEYVAANMQQLLARWATLGGG